MTVPRDHRALPDGLSERLGFLLGRAHAEHREGAVAALRSLGLDVKEVGALRILADEGPLSQQRLGERQGIDRTTMVAIADALEERGLVERRRDPRDRRAYALRVTAAGRGMLGRAERAIEGAEEEFLAPLAPRDRDRLKALLRQALERAGAPSRASPRSGP
jgi:DNA-binding MarR family transcriptional regulator